MQKSIPLSIACGLLLAGAVHAVDAPAQPVRRLAQLPAEVVAILEEMGPVSDPGGPFNPSDAIDPEHPVPGQRLVSGQAGPDVIQLTLEKAGRGQSHAVLTFARVDGHWRFVSQEHLLEGQAP